MVYTLKVLHARMHTAKICKKIFIRNFRTSSIKSSCILDHSPNTKLKSSLVDKYMCLPTPECKSFIEFVWIDGTGDHLRSKAKVFNFIPDSHKELPTWTYNGSYTLQSKGDEADLFLNPIALYNDPFRRGNNKLVLCDTYMPNHKPTKTNRRHACVEAINCACEHEPMFSFEQEYFLYDVDKRPFGWPIMRGEPRYNKPYYCSVGAGRVYGRSIIEAHSRACLYAGIPISELKAEASPSQWEFHVGPCAGIRGADDLWMARYILERVAEEYGVCISFDPKPFPNYKGSSCHTNFASKAMRADNGIKAIEAAICLLEQKHEDHMKVYDNKGGADNKKRLAGNDDCSFVKFTSGVGSKRSVKIKNSVAAAKKGFLEDRRPASNCDPYAVTRALLNTCLLNK